MCSPSPRTLTTCGPRASTRRRRRPTPSHRARGARPSCRAVVAGARDTRRRSAVKSRSKISLPLTTTNGSSRAVGIEQRQRVLEAAAGAEDRRLVAVLDARAEAAAVAELALDHVAAVVRVDDELADAVRDEVRDPVREDRDAAHRAASAWGTRRRACRAASTVRRTGASRASRTSHACANGTALRASLPSRRARRRRSIGRSSPTAELVLADACAFDRATEVADEKLFGAGPRPKAAPGAFGARSARGTATRSSGSRRSAARWLRVLAVVPARAQAAAQAARCSRRAKPRARRRGTAAARARSAGQLPRRHR